MFLSHLVGYNNFDISCFFLPGLEPKEPSVQKLMGVLVKNTVCHKGEKVTKYFAYVQSSDCWLYINLTDYDKVSTCEEVISAFALYLKFHNYGFLNLSFSLCNPGMAFDFP